MVDGTDGETCGMCGSSLSPGAATCGTCGAEVGAHVPTGAQPPEEATNWMRTGTAGEDVTTIMRTDPAGEDVTTIMRTDTADVEQDSTTTLRAASTGSVWPGLTAAGLPPRVPRQADDDEVFKQAFMRSWEAESTSPTPLTRAPFTPSYLAVPPNPVEPPGPIEPPAPPAPPPGPSPFPAPNPVPVPPVPMPPTPIPPGPPVPAPPPDPPVPAPPPDPPVPAPPAPFPAPPGPVPPPPAISPARTGAPARLTSPSVYQGGNYGELETQSITGFVVGEAAPTATAVVGQRYLTGEYEPLSGEMSGSLTGHILSRGMAKSKRRERRARVQTVLWVGGGLILFAVGIAVVVDLLAGDFISSLFKTFSDFAE